MCHLSGSRVLAYDKLHDCPFSFRIEASLASALQVVAEGGEKLPARSLGHENNNTTTARIVDCFCVKRKDMCAALAVDNLHGVHNPDFGIERSRSHKPSRFRLRVAKGH